MGQDKTEKELPLIVVVEEPRVYKSIAEMCPMLCINLPTKDDIGFWDHQVRVYNVQEKTDQGL